MILVLDCETTGLPTNYDAPVTDVDNWPRAVQIAWATFENNGSEIKHCSYLIRPDGFEIPADVTAIHGISTELARENGYTINVILISLAQDLREAALVVGHNLEFDANVLGAEYIRAGYENYLDFIGPTIDTMKNGAVIDFCALPGKRGYKWPKLSELMNALSFEPGNRHDALSDVMDTAKCFFELLKRGVLSLPADMAAPINDKIDMPEFEPQRVAMSEWIEQEIKLNEELQKANQEEQIVDPVTRDDEAFKEFQKWAELQADVPCPVLEPAELANRLVRTYENLKQTRMTLHHAEFDQWAAQRELNCLNFELRKSEGYAACKNEQQRSDYLYEHNQERTHVLEIASTDALGSKLDFEIARDEVELARALLRIAELSSNSQAL